MSGYFKYKKSSNLSSISCDIVQRTENLAQDITYF